MKIPRLAGTKFKYSHIDREDRARDLSRGLDLLCMARVAFRVRHSSGNGVPLGAGADDRAFKVLGGIAEQFVGQHLL